MVTNNDKNNKLLWDYIYCDWRTVIEINTWCCCCRVESISIDVVAAVCGTAVLDVVLPFVAVFSIDDSCNSWSSDIRLYALTP